MDNPALVRVAEAGEWQWAVGDTPGAVIIGCRPGAELPWSLRFFTVRATKAGKPARKSHLVRGRSLGRCVMDADDIVASLREEIERGREAWRERTP